MASAFAESIETWGSDRGRTPTVFALEKTLAAGNALFEAIVGHEALWRNHVFVENQFPYDHAEEGEILEGYRTLVASSGPILTQLDTLERAGHVFAGAGPFRAHYRAAQETLDDDAARREAEKMAPSREPLRARIARMKVSPPTKV